MKAWQKAAGGLAAAILLMLPALPAQAARLTAYERSQGWRLLFDGATTWGWHGYKSNKAPVNWRVEEGALVCSEDAGPALVSDETFKDFELSFQWKVAAGGRAELFFRLSEDGARPDDTSPVFQLGGEGVECGGDGGLTKPWRETTVPPATWQQARLIVFGNQVEYWINGRQVSTYLLGGPEWRAAVATVRQSAARDFGQQPDGAVALAGRGAAFRDIRLRAL